MNINSERFNLILFNYYLVSIVVNKNRMYENLTIKIWQLKF